MIIFILSLEISLIFSADSIPSLQELARNLHCIDISLFTVLIEVLVSEDMYRRSDSWIQQVLLRYPRCVFTDYHSPKASHLISKFLLARANANLDNLMNN